MKRDKSMSIYAGKVSVRAEDTDHTYVTLEDVSVDEIVAEFSSEELLDAISSHFDFSTVYDYTINRKAEDEEYRD